MSQTFPAETLSPGQASGAVFVLAEPLSFWGGLDPAAGTIIDAWHRQKGMCISGRVLLMKSGRGSSSGSSVLAEAIRAGAGPAAIVLMSRDAIVTVGAMVAGELYGKHCPVVLVDEPVFERLARCATLAIEAPGNPAEIRAV